MLTAGDGKQKKGEEGDTFRVVMVFMLAGIAVAEAMSGRYWIAALCGLGVVLQLWFKD